MIDRKGKKKQGLLSDKWLLFGVPLPESIRNDLKICSNGPGAEAATVSLLYNNHSGKAH